jgi:hypothetical protein
MVQQDAERQQYDICVPSEAIVSILDVSMAIISKMKGNNLSLYVFVYL